MKKSTIIFLALCVVFTAGCRWVGIRGNGNIKTDERTVSAFANIDASGTFQIEWQNGTPAVRGTTDENLFPYIDNHISGDTLHLDTREQIWPTREIKVVIFSPTRAGARISGAVRLTANQVVGPKFALEATGASRVTLEGSIGELLTDMTGAGKVIYSGNPKTIERHITGAGFIRHRD